RDDARAAQLRPCQLGEAVDRFLQQLWRGVCVLVPALVGLRLTQPEVRSDVDDRATLPEPTRREPRGLARRQRGEHDLRVADLAADRQRRGSAVEVRLDVAQRLALMRARDDRDDSSFRMAQEQARELAAGIAGDANDRDADGHPVIMRLNAYLCNR